MNRYVARFGGSIAAHALLNCAVFSLLLALSPVTGSAQEISARLFQNESTHVALRISVRHEGPISLIAQLFFPPGYRIRATEPAAAKVDSSKGVIKWLVKNDRQRVITLYAFTEKPLALANVQGVIRYRRAADGSIADIQAEHP